MSYRDALNLRNTVEIHRTTRTADGMGSATYTSTSTVLERAAIWAAGASKGLVSDQLMAISSHILACLPTDDVLYNDEVVYSGVTYTITGHPENVMFRGEILVVPLQRVN